MAARRYSLGALVLVGLLGVGIGMAIAGAAIRGGFGVTKRDSSVSMAALPAAVSGDTVVAAGVVAPEAPPRVPKEAPKSEPVTRSSAPPTRSSEPATRGSESPASSAEPAVAHPRRVTDSRWTPIDATAKFSVANGDSGEGLFMDFHTVEWAHDDPVLWVRQVYPAERGGLGLGGSQFRVKSWVKQFWFDCSSRKLLALQGLAYDGAGRVSHHYESLDPNSTQFSAIAAQAPTPDANSEPILDAVCAHFRFSR